MAVLDLDLAAGTTYQFQGWGVAPVAYEKGRPLTNYAADLGSSALDDYCQDLALFSWLRVHCVGGEFYREATATDRNYPAKRQAEVLSKILRAANFRVIVSPFSAPSSCMAEDDQTTLRPSGLSLTTSDDHTTLQAFTANDTNWQAWLDAIDHGLRLLRQMGANVEILETPNEYGHSSSASIANFWLSYLTNANAVAYVNKIWLGTGLSGGGIKSRYTVNGTPTLKFLSGYPVNSTGQNSIHADGTAGPEVSYWGLNNYGDGLSSTGGNTLGLGATTYRYGKGILTEWGTTVTGAITATQVRNFLHSAHQSVVYCRCFASLMWTSLRDITVKAGTDTRGVTYTAKPLMDMNTAAGTYSYTALWWALKPYLLAAGRGTVAAYCAASQTDLDTDANFTPAASVYLNAFQRRDGTYGVVYANFSGSSRTDDIDFGTDYSGTRTDYLPLAGSGNEGTPGAASTSSGVLDLGTVANNTVVLLELS